MFKDILLVDVDIMDIVALDGQVISRFAEQITFGIDVGENFHVAL
jgi:hypothetical protein